MVDLKLKKECIKVAQHPQDIIDELGITADKLPLGVLMVNSKHEKEEYILQEGDIVALFPKIGGG